MYCTLLILSFSVAHAEDSASISPSNTAAASAASLIGIGFGGCRDTVTTIAGLDSRLWPQPELEAVVPLQPRFLAKVKDMRGIGWLGTDKNSARIPDVFDNPDEGLAFVDAIGKAARTPAKVFADDARRDLRNSDFLNEALANVEREKARARGIVAQGVLGGSVGQAGWRSTCNQPRPTLRGTVVHLEGSLRRVYPQNVPTDLERAGIKNLYEGWVLDQSNPKKVWYILFTDLPPEIGEQTNENLAADVEFDGYYLKVMRYEAIGTKGFPNRPEEAVVVVGRAPIVIRVGAAQRDPWSEVIAPGLAVVTCLILGGIIIMNWRYRRGDRKLLAAIEAKRPVVIPDTIPGQLREEAVAFNEPAPVAEVVQQSQPDFSGKSLEEPPASQ
jgi:hypothetical protein